MKFPYFQVQAKCNQIQIKKNNNIVNNNNEITFLILEKVVLCGNFVDVNHSIQGHGYEIWYLIFFII